MRSDMSPFIQAIWAEMEHAQRRALRQLNQRLMRDGRSVLEPPDEPPDEPTTCPECGANLEPDEVGK